MYAKYIHVTRDVGMSRAHKSLITSESTWVSYRRVGTSINSFLKLYFSHLITARLCILNTILDLEK